MYECKYNGWSMGKYRSVRRAEYCAKWPSVLQPPLDVAPHLRAFLSLSFELDAPPAAALWAILILCSFSFRILTV